MNRRRKTIIITGLLAILISYIVMTPKEAEKEYFTLYIGDEAEHIEMSRDWTATKRTILDRVQPLWENLESGESVVFYLERVESTDPSASIKKSVEEKYGEDSKITSTATSTSPKWRFFKNRKTRSAEDGRNGLEYMGDEFTKPNVLLAGNVEEWETIKSYLDENVLEVQGHFYSFGFEDTQE